MGGAAPRLRPSCVLFAAWDEHRRQQAARHHEAMEAATTNHRSAEAATRAEVIAAPPLTTALALIPIWFAPSSSPSEPRLDPNL